MIDITRQRIRHDDIETSTALQILSTAFNAASKEDQAYGDIQIILSYLEILKKFYKEYTPWNSLNIHPNSPVTATNMRAESVFAVFKIREVRN